MKQVTVIMSKSLTQPIHINTDLFRYETSDCRYEQIIESLTQPIHLKTLICSDMKQVTVIMSKSLNHWLSWFILKHWSGLRFPKAS